MVKMSDEEIKNMTPDEIRKMMQKGADLDDKGEPKQKDSSSTASACSQQIQASQGSPAWILS